MGKFKIRRAGFLALVSLGLSLALLPLSGAITTHASEESQTASDQTSPVSGAGAHFAWIMFKELQTDIEKYIGRPEPGLCRNNLTQPQQTH